MVNKSYIPQKGDLVFLNFNPQSGHEQSGLRPALVISPGRYNERMGLALVCPITSRMKGLSFEVALPAGKKINGVILADQLKSIDWKARTATFVEKVSPLLLGETLEKILPLLLEE